MKEYIKHGLNFLGGWFIWMFVLLATTLILSGAKKTPSIPSVYNNQNYFNMVLFADQPIYLDETMFPEKREGIVTLTGDTFVPLWNGGFVEVNGTCTMKYRPNQFYVIILVDDIPFVVVENNDLSGTFSVTVPVGQIKIWVRQDKTSNSMRCNIKFEGVR